MKPLTPRLFGSALWGLALACACDVPRDPEPVELRAAGPTSAPANTPTPSRPRGRLVAGERVERVPSWPDPAELDARVRERLSATALAAVDRAPVPVLAPADPSWDAPTVTASGPGYALSTHAGRRSLVVQASRSARLVPGVGRHTGRDRLRGAPGFVSENDGIKVASWIERGTAYSLEIECDDPESSGCSLEALRAEVERLVPVGGAGVGVVGGVP